MVLRVLIAHIPVMCLFDLTLICKIACNYDNFYMKLYFVEVCISLYLVYYG
ncbi:hypothetical protein GCM10028778_13170 [Barrientosiimonas marina]